VISDVREESVTIVVLELAVVVDVVVIDRVAVVVLVVVVGFPQLYFIYAYFLGLLLHGIESPLTVILQLFLPTQLVYTKLALPLQSFSLLNTKINNN
jgi:hypothetical protein